MKSMADKGIPKCVSAHLCLFVYVIHPWIVFILNWKNIFDQMIITAMVHMLDSTTPTHSDHLVENI